MIEKYLRPVYESVFVKPVAPLFAKRMTPNRVTYYSCLSGVIAGLFLMLGLPIFAIIALLISGYLDTLDGTLARMAGKVTSQGAVYDIMSDRIVEFAVILGLYAVDPLHRGSLTLIMMGSCFVCVTSFLIVGIFTPNDSQKSFHYSSGLIERTETFLFFMAMIWFPKHFALLAVVFTSLVLFTSYRRVEKFTSLYSTTSIPG
jgi:archaetidylinositol phosphate synthase